MVGPFAGVRFVLPLLAASLLIVNAELGQAKWLQVQVPSTEYVLQQSTLIAHVQVAGKIQFGNRSVQVVEVLDAVRGPAAGQLVLVEFDRYASERDNSLKKVGEQLFLFAKRNELGLYHPHDERHCAVPLDSDGTIIDIDRAQFFLPPSKARNASAVMAHLRTICGRPRAKLQVQLNKEDVVNYKRDRPLRVEITIENQGEDDFQFQNRIEYDYVYTPFIDLERLQKEQAEETLAPPVQLYVQRLGRLREQQALEEMARHLSVSESLGPGQRATGSFDLGEEYDVRGGGTFAVWAELGGARSPSVVLEVPRADEAVEELAKLEELAHDDGPFHVARRVRRIDRSMPSVEPIVEGAAIEAAMTYWFSSRLSGRHHLLDENTDELVVLRSAHITSEYAPIISGIRFLASDASWLNDGKPTELSTSCGPAKFHWRTLRIKSVHVQGARATVEIIQNERHNLGGSGAKINLRRNGGVWQVDGEVLMWKS